MAGLSNFLYSYGALQSNFCHCAGLICFLNVHSELHRAGIIVIISIFQVVIFKLINYLQPEISNT